MHNIAESLSQSERKILPLIKNNISFEELTKHSKLQEIEVMRALQWLENKNIIKINKQLEEGIFLDKNGEKYLKEGLPEFNFLKILNKELTLQEIKDSTKLSENELNISLGILKRRLAIELKKGKVKITENGKRILKKGSLEHNFLKKLPLDPKHLTDEQKFAYHELKSRKEIIKTDIIKKRNIELTSSGEKLQKIKLDSNLIDSLTPKIIREGTWKSNKFKRYDTKINVPKTFGGRKHPLTAIMDLIRDIFVEMGFQEMKGPWVETAFWCMDSMWIPQDHPAREVQDTFYLPNKGKLPENNIVNKVKAAHQTGGNTGSKGYGGQWDPEIAKQLLLRTHTTATTYRYFGLKDIKKMDRAKFFYVGRIFRNESIDATHLAEFHQVEGFVMDDELSLKNLMGFIKEFYSKMGIHEIKFKVTYNPYTESSLEALYYDKKSKKWIELINSGIFRPESLEPYGIKKPVIAWGLGVERLAMILYEKGKLKELLGPNCDLDWIRNYKIPIRKW